MIDEKKSVDLNDPIEELRHLRDEHAKKFNFDMKAIFDDFKQFAKENNLKTVSLPIQRVAKKTG